MCERESAHELLTTVTFLYSPLTSPRHAMAAADEAYPVKVYVYDLSHGMMAALSPSLLGTRLDGLWHTAVVVYGHEYKYLTPIVDGSNDHIAR